MNEQLRDFSIFDTFMGSPGGFAIREQTSLVYNPSLGLRGDDKEILLYGSKGTVGFDLRFIQNSGGMTVVEAIPQKGMDVCVLKFDKKGHHYWSDKPNEASDPEGPHHNNIRISSVTPEVSSDKRFQPHDPGLVRVETPTGEVRFYLVKAAFEGKPDNWNINYSVTEGSLPKKEMFGENKKRLLALFGRAMLKRLVSEGSSYGAELLLKNLYNLYSTGARYTDDQEVNGAITHFQTAGDLKYFRAGLWNILDAAKVALRERQYDMDDYRFAHERFQVPDTLIEEGSSYFISRESLDALMTLGRYISRRLSKAIPEQRIPDYINALVNSVPLTASLTLDRGSFYFEMFESVLLRRIERAFAEMVRGMQNEFQQNHRHINLPGPLL